MYDIQVEIAGVPMLIRCSFEEFRLYFRNYLTEKEPRFIIEPTSADIERVRKKYGPAGDTDDRSKPRKAGMFFELNAIHGLVAEKMVSENVLLMHGSALSFDGEAVVFTAKSGTGKSTHTRLWREAFGDRVVMINDDKPLLQIEDGSVTVFGTPWNGKHHLDRNISAPLKAIVSLERDSSNRISPISKTNAFPILVEASYRSKDPVSAARIIGMEKKLLDVTDFYTLGCNMDPDAVRVACDGIFGSGAYRIKKRK